MTVDYIGIMLRQYMLRIWRHFCLHPYRLKWAQLHLTVQIDRLKSGNIFFFITEHREIKVSQHRYENRNQSRDIKKSCLSQTLIWLTMSLVVSELFGESLCNNYPQNNASRSESEISALLHFWLSEQACRGFMRLLTSPKVKYFSKPSWYMP